MEAMYIPSSVSWYAPMARVMKPAVNRQDAQMSRPATLKHFRRLRRQRQRDRSGRRESERAMQCDGLQSVVEAEKRAWEKSER